MSVSDPSGVPTDAECLDWLRQIAEEAKQVWDERGQPYPDHLRALIYYLSDHPKTVIR